MTAIFPCLALAAEQPPSRPQATVTIEAGVTAKPYDRMIFGGFLEHFDNQIYGGVFEPGSPLADPQGFRTDVIAALKELKVSVIRWPGGCFVDGYHWRKGVGKEREAYGDPRWGSIEPNTFGTDEFIELCRRLGAAPYICQNGLASVQEMADWVAYCNTTNGDLAELRKKNGHPEPYNVKFWSVGNERYDKAYIARVRDGAKAMKEADPSIVVTCAGSQGGIRKAGFQVSPSLLTQAGAKLDLISVHNYWLPRGQQLPRYDYLTAITKSEAPDAYLATLRASLGEFPEAKHLKIAFDEWNLRAWQHPGFPKDAVADFSDPKSLELIAQRRRENDLPEQYTMADALFAASFLNACLRHSDLVTMANIAPLVNTRGPLFVHSKGIVRRTFFHTLAMYANLLQDRVASARVTSGKLTHGDESVAELDALATVNESGKQWSIAVINRHPAETVDCTVKLGGLLLEGKYHATMLTGDSADAYNDVGHTDRVKPQSKQVSFQKGVINLPPHSLTIIQVTMKQP